MSEKAPMPPWWVERVNDWPEPIYVIYGGKPGDAAVEICSFHEAEFSNAKELADLIVQRTKQ